MTDKRKLTRGWRIGEEYAQSKQADFVKRMTEETLKEREGKPSIWAVPTHFEGKLIKDLSGEEKERFHFSLQPKSTQDAITRQKTRNPKDDLDYLLRPMPDCVAVPNAADKDALTGIRNVPIDDIMLHEDIRHKARNTRGTEDLSNLTMESRKRGLEAFTSSKPAELTLDELKKVTKLEEMKSEKIEPEQPKKEGFLKRLWNSCKPSGIIAP